MANDIIDIISHYFFIQKESRGK